MISTLPGKGSISNQLLCGWPILLIRAAFGDSHAVLREYKVGILCELDVPCVNMDFFYIKDNGSVSGPYFAWFLGMCILVVFYCASR